MENQEKQRDPGIFVEIKKRKNDMGTTCARNYPKRTQREDYEEEVLEQY